MNLRLPKSTAACTLPVILRFYARPRDPLHAVDPAQTTSDGTHHPPSLVLLFDPEWPVGGLALSQRSGRGRGRGGRRLPPEREECTPGTEAVDKVQIYGGSGPSTYAPTDGQDFELAFWQLTYLVVSPRRVYKQVYHQWVTLPQRL